MHILACGLLLVVRTVSKLYIGLYTIGCLAYSTYFCVDSETWRINFKFYYFKFGGRERNKSYYIFSSHSKFGWGNFSGLLPPSPGIAPMSVTGNMKYF